MISTRLRGYKKRIKDQELLDSYRGKPCVICGLGGVAHHLRSRKAFGHDVKVNLLCLCNKHHTEVHAIGMTTFVNKYKVVKDWLIENKWYFDEFTNKWRHEDAGT